MLSGSSSASASPQAASKLAHLFGVLIALITLTLPAIVITSYTHSATSPALGDRTASFR
jgi:hypothetical protein